MPDARPAAFSGLSQGDPDVRAILQRELRRQEDHLELIASENYVSPEVMAAQGSALTNKYAEGYPGKRYYGGCQVVDMVEELALLRAKELFGARYANVQPHSGAQANAATLLALVKPGDTLMGMALDQGGHLTHGSPVNFSGKLYDFVHYGLDEDGLLDYDAMRALALERRPRLIVGGFSAYSQVVDWARMRAIADEVGAYLMVDMAHVAGLVAAGVYPSPVPHAHVVTSTTHKTLRGPRGGLILSAEDDPKFQRRLNSGLFPGTQGGPLMHVIAAKAVCFGEAQRPEFADYARKVVANAAALCQAMQKRQFRIVSGGTANHLFLVDLRGGEMHGGQVEEMLDRAGITLNKNAVPKDDAPPARPSGLRIGTPAATTRGMGAAEMEQIAAWIAELVEDPSDARIRDVGGHVAELCRRFPVYG